MDGTQLAGHDIAIRLRDFEGVSLADLNARASLASRHERKYVVHAEVLDRLLADWRRHFDVLEIDGKTAFRYRSLYFDGEGYRSFHDHHQGRRIRCKVRTRHYVDVDEHYLEVKLKGARGRTLKSRIAYRPGPCPTLDACAMEEIGRTYFEVYRRPWEGALQPSIQVNYTRTTLVAKQGGMRVTLDRNLEFIAGSATYSVDPGRIIVETKSEGRSAVAARTLRGVNLHRVSRCSKYCIGLAALGLVDRFNNFRSTMNILNIK